MIMRRSGLLLPFIVVLLCLHGGLSLELTGLDSCNDADTPCLNGGVCVKTTNQITGAVQSSCTCPIGAAGARCEEACDLRCLHGGSCRHNEDDAHRHSGTPSFECECTGPYRGAECEVPVATCPVNGGQDGAALECLWGGSCVVDEESSEFKCKCPSGRSGESCEEEDSDNNFIEIENDPDGTTNIVGTCLQDTDCANKGLCVLAHDSGATAAAGVPTKRAQCLCALGWGGDACERSCMLDCQHSSSCRFALVDKVAAEDMAYCDCDRDRFKGEKCEIAVARCPGIGGVECLHGGGCVAVPGDGDFYTCACPKGRLGPRCETPDPDYHEENSVAQTLSNSEDGINPVVFIILVVAVALFIFLPITILIVKRSNPRNGEMHTFTTEGSNGKNTDQDSSGDGSIDSAGQPKDGQFV